VTAVSAPPIVLGRGLRKTYRRGVEEVHALRGVDIAVAKGEILGIAGASGSGKSTLLAVLCGWEQPDSGTVEFGDSAVEPARLAWADLALLPQTLGLLDELPAYENVILPARLAGAQAEHADRARELMTRLGVDHLADRYADQMSLGEQQRVALARTLLLRPRLVLVDEPTAHQDARWAGVVLDMLRERSADGGACILVSHHQQALASADSIRHMSDGVLA
jgi:putative ABC transport system ATP-binding protein